MQAVYRFVINKVYLNMLLHLETGKKQKLKEIASYSGVNYAHLSMVMQQLCQEGIIGKDVSGRSYELSLTQKGQELIRNLKKVKAILDDWEEYKKRMEEENGNTTIASKNKERKTNKKV